MRLLIQRSRTVNVMLCRWAIEKNKSWGELVFYFESCWEMDVKSKFPMVCFLQIGSFYYKRGVST